MTQVIIRFNGRNIAVDLHPFDTPATLLERLASQNCLSHSADPQIHHDERLHPNTTPRYPNSNHLHRLRVVHQGRTLPPTSPLPFPTNSIHSLDIVPRLLGGGGDGGSTGAESRSTYLEMYAGKKHAKVNPEEERLARWTNCNLSGLPLQPPCVCDPLGFLYNKEALVSALLAKTLPHSLSYITGLKSLTDVKLEMAPIGGSSKVRFTCPVTGLEANGKVKFVVIRTSGHVFSDKAVRELKSIVEEMVGGPWSPDDDMVLNPSGEEVQGKRNALLAQVAAEKAAKKSKKDKKRAKTKRNIDDDDHGDIADDDGRTNIISTNNNNNKKKLKSEHMMPAGATSEVWNSLFKKDNDGKGTGKKNHNDDFLNRGTGVRYMG